MIHLISKLSLCIVVGIGIYVYADVAHLKTAYPNHIKEVSDQYIIWNDGTYMSLGISHSNEEKLQNPSLRDQLEDVYSPGISYALPLSDPGRSRYEPFFTKMYGSSPEEVTSHLQEIDWMPRVFGKGTYSLLVTTVNDVHKKVQNISNELEELVFCNPEYAAFLDNPGGCYAWRTVAHTARLSPHAFGIALDINVEHSHYWQWDLERDNHAINEEFVLAYRNAIPWEIVLIFEKHGFIWGGKWYHYDTMHFEYRPELLCKEL